VRVLSETLGSLVELRMATFGDRWLITDGHAKTAGDLDRAYSAIMQTGGASRVWDAIVESVAVLRQYPATRDVILVTDGRASGNIRGFDEALASAQRDNVSIHVIALDAPYNRLVNRDRPGDPTDRLRVIAHGTRGGYVEAELTDIVSACRQFATTVAAKIRRLQGSQGPGQLHE